MRVKAATLIMINHGFIIGVITTLDYWEIEVKIIDTGRSDLDIQTKDICV